MEDPVDGEMSAADLDLTSLRQRVETNVRGAVENHEHLDIDEFDIITMYVVGSFGAGQARKGSDLDLLVMVQYRGDATGIFDWLEYMQSDIEPILKRNHSSLAEPLPYVSHVDPKIGDQIDCETFLRDMTQHGEYEKVYDLYDEAFLNADRLH